MLDMFTGEKFTNFFKVQQTSRLTLCLQQKYCRNIQFYWLYIFDLKVEYPRKPVNQPQTINRTKTRKSSFSPLFAACVSASCWTGRFLHMFGGGGDRNTAAVVFRGLDTHPAGPQEESEGSTDVREMCVFIISWHGDVRIMWDLQEPKEMKSGQLHWLRIFFKMKARVYVSLFPARRHMAFPSNRSFFCVCILSPD